VVPVVPAAEVDRKETIEGRDTVRRASLTYRCNSRAGTRLLRCKPVAVALTTKRCRAAALPRPCKVLNDRRPGRHRHAEFRLSRTVLNPGTGSLR
jgi:hypothetical protein